MEHLYFKEMDTSKLSIVFVHQDGDITGSAISLSNMINGLVGQGHRVQVIIPKNGQGIRLWESSGAIVHVFPFTTFWTSPGPRCLSRAGIKQLKALFRNDKLKNFILNLEPDLVHINDKAAIQAGISMAGTNIPIIQHSRSAYHLTACKLNAWLSATAIKQFAHQIICISEDEIQGFESATNKTILYNTVDLNLANTAILQRERLRESLGIKPTDIVIGMAESFNINKGLVEIIEIAKKTLNQNIENHIKFLLVGKITNSDSVMGESGKISSEQYLTNFIHQNSFDDSFILTGFKKDVLNYIAAMDILVVAKAHGVVGRQPIEAQACATPIIGLNGHSKNSTIVINGVGGYLLNNLTEVIIQIQKLVKSPNELKQLGINGINYAQSHFNPLNYSEKLITLYYKTLSEFKNNHTSSR